MIKLVSALGAWGTPNFENILKVEIQEIEPEQLPLQKRLSQTSYVFDSDIQVLVLNIRV